MWYRRCGLWYMHMHMHMHMHIAHVHAHVHVHVHVCACMVLFLETSFWPRGGAVRCRSNAGRERRTGRKKSIVALGSLGLLPTILTLSS